MNDRILDPGGFTRIQIRPSRKTGSRSGSNLREKNPDTTYQIKLTFYFFLDPNPTIFRKLDPDPTKTPGTDSTKTPGSGSETLMNGDMRTEGS